MGVDNREREGRERWVWITGREGRERWVWITEREKRGVDKRER